VKLLHCMMCGDVFQLRMKERACECGRCSGKYVDRVNAEVSGPCVSLAIGNGDLRRAIAVLSSSPQDFDRSFYQGGPTRLAYVWVRPNSGPRNPPTTHTTAPAPGQEGGE